MLSKENLKLIIENILMISEEQIMKYNKVPTTGFIVKHHESGFDINIVDCNFSNDGEKHFKKELLKMLAIELKADAVVFASEAWMSIATPGKENMRPSNDPDRTEVLIILAVTPKYKCLLLQEISCNTSGKHLTGEPIFKWEDEDEICINLLSDIWPAVVN